MAGVADKARFYLERAAPQLREFEEKQIFSTEEIRTLVTKRSEHEHLILSPGSLPADFLSYAKWEQSLDALRAKRCRRLRIRPASSAAAAKAADRASSVPGASALSAHASHARTFGIFERAVAKHPGCVALWRAYLDACAGAGATRRWRKVVTRALRMHPREEGLWVLAGRTAAGVGDMAGARGLFMRGCRFCSGWGVWVEYARLEMEWLERMERKQGGRRKVLEAELAAVDGGGEGAEIRFDEDEGEADGEDGGNGDIALVDLDGDAELPKPAVFDEQAVQKLARSPALDGAIPLAIFDISLKQRFAGPESSEAFFDMFALFTEVSSQSRILQHVLASMKELHPRSAATCSCLIRQPLIGTDMHTPAFARAVREFLARLKTYTEVTDNESLLASKVITWIDPVLAAEDFDEGLRAVLEHTKQRLETL